MLPEEQEARRKLFWSILGIFFIMGTIGALCLLVTESYRGW